MIAWLPLAFSVPCLVIVIALSVFVDMTRRRR